MSDPIAEAMAMLPTMKETLARYRPDCHIVDVLHSIEDSRNFAPYAIAALEAQAARITQLDQANNNQARTIMQQEERIAELEAELDLQKGDLMNLPKTIEEIESVIGKPDMYGGITNSGFYQVKDRRYYFTGHLCNTQITKIHAAIEAFTFLHVEALEARIAELEDREKQFKSGINHAFETADRAVSLGSQIAALAQTRSTLYGLLAILDGGKGAG